MDPKVTKKRKLTDKSIPNAILQNPEFAQDSKMYQELVDTERRLDWTMTRKRYEVQDALARNPQTSRTLRIFMSHTTSSQIWQTNGEQIPNYETGENVPAWSFRIEGRLLEIPNQRNRDRVPMRKFSTFIKKMVVELDRDNHLYPDGNIVEWPRAYGAPTVPNPVLDGFTIRRSGDTPTAIRIVIYVEHFPEQFKLADELADMLGIQEESRLGAIQAVWNYIKVQGLQDKADRRMVRADDKLRKLFGGTELINFAKIPEIINRYLIAAPPIELHYTLDPTVPPPERPQAWDIEVKMEDSALKNRMAAMIQGSKESAGALGKLDEEIALLAQSLHNSHVKKTFLQQFADDPAKFIETWLESQSKDLESILGSGPTEGMTIRQEELRRSEFFQLPWVEEAVAVHHGQSLALKDRP